MSKRPNAPAIRLRGVRQHNLKNIDLDLPLGRLIVFTGLSGSGKSSLAFDTLFAEGQRRYIETFSPYARQFFDRMDKPAADRIDGILPAVAIEQRNSVKTTRSTVGTMTEICDYMKTLWLHLARLYCRSCGNPVRKDSPASVWERCLAAAGAAGSDALITFDLPLSEKLSLEESLGLLARQGYQRLYVDGEAARLEEAVQKLKRIRPSGLVVVQDRLFLRPASRTRFIEACEQAYHFGKGRLSVRVIPRGADGDASIGSPQFMPFSNRLRCARCAIDYREPGPALFSYNHPSGACPTCHGFGRTISIDYDLALPDRSLTLAQGVVRPWRTGFSAECQEDLIEFAAKRGVPANVPFCELSKEYQDWVVQGDPGYGKDKAHEWPHAWYGVKGYFRWLESRSYKMHVRVLLSRYRAYETCPACQGARFQPEALLYRIDPGELNHGSAAEAVSAASRDLTLADFYRLPIRDALALIETMTRRRLVRLRDPLGMVMEEVRARLRYLVEVGLGYLTLDRPTRTLSGGETERVSLTTCLGTRLVNTLFVLDEPTVGLHPRDTARIVRVLQQLRDAGNTVVAVEHEAGVIRAADQVVDLGPGSGERGGRVVFQGTFAGLVKSKASLTGQYLAGHRRIEPSRRRPVGPGSGPRLVLRRVCCHNLKDLAVELPLGRFVCVTGVSGSGKTTLIRDVLYPALESRLKGAGLSPALAASEARDAADASAESGESASSEELDQGRGQGSASVDLRGWESLSRVVLVDQSPLGKTPRSNPAVYTGAFDDIRELFAQSDPARQRGLAASAFSFNSPQGQCERCRGAGFEKIEMQFLSDVFIRCPDCGGRRYRPHILDVRISPPGQDLPSWSVADLLEATVDESVAFLERFGESRFAMRAIGALRSLQEVGLGYLRLGQPINTLSGGESQRLKLVRHLQQASGPTADPTQAPGRTLFLFDEPTTGLHFDDVRVLLQALQRLVDAGHSLVVIEHHLEVVRSADWVIDLGPEAGEEGGRIVVQGTADQVSLCPESHTGKALQS